jgi:hypothetical protein
MAKFSVLNGEKRISPNTDLLTAFQTLFSDDLVEESPLTIPSYLNMNPE